MSGPDAALYAEDEKPIDIKYYLFLIRKNLYVIITFFVITLTLAVLYTSKTGERYQTSAQLMIEKPQGYMGSSAAENAPEAAAVTGDFYDTQIEIMKGTALLSAVAQELKLKDYYGVDNEESVINRLRGMVSLKRVGGSRLFNINIVADEPRLAQSIANAVARAYVRKNFEDSLYYSREILNWLPKEGSDPNEKITLEDPLGGMRQVSREQLIESLPALRTDETLRALREKKSALDADLDLLLRQYREKHPVVVKARANLKFLEDNIRNERERIIEGLKSQAEGTYRIGAARIIEEAKLPKSPLPNNRKQTIMMIALIELIVSILLVFLLDYFDDTIHSTEDFERKGLTNLPFLGPIPLLKEKIVPKDKRALISFYGKNSNIAESFRYLRVAINFSAPPESLKLLMFSSCLPSEGKSFISHNTAVSLAMDGNKTLLVDCDLRRPTLHTAFKMDNSIGISNFLTSSIGLDAVAKETFVENLTVVTSGPMSPNPGEILGSDRMKVFLAAARENFDRVIIDCPPLTGIGDSFVVGGLLGQMIMVIGANRTPADLIKHTQKHLDKSGIKIIGVALNMVDIEKERHSGYSRHYYTTYNRYYNNEGIKS